MAAMLLIEHRVNTLEHLGRVPTNHGVEVDIRERGGHLCLAHDPFQDGERLDDFLRAYEHALIIFNVKCDGLEGRILELVEKHQIKSYFFLDVANPTMVGLAQGGMRQVAVRYSEYEPIEYSLAFAGKVDWVWVDCFTHLPLDPESYRRLHEHFKICVVSPELQGHERDRIKAFQTLLNNMPVDAVCTDYCEDWESRV